MSQIINALKVDSSHSVYSVNLSIQFEYRKIRTRKNAVLEHFSRSVIDLRLTDWLISQTDSFIVEL